MSDLERRKRRQPHNKAVNGWKWAFIGLVVLIISSLFLLFQVLQPVEVNESSRSSNENSQEMIELSTSLNKMDTQRLMNSYLSTVLGEEFESYSIVLSNQLEIHGDVEVFSAAVPFALLFDPYVMENGNIQLRSEGVEVAGFSLPVNLVMRLVGNQIDFPAFIAFDSEAQRIMIDLNELSKSFNFDIEMTQIDLIDDRIELKLHLDEKTLFENF